MWVVVCEGNTDETLNFSKPSYWVVKPHLEATLTRRRTFPLV